jgi:dinuclear metal center YbgI/SA1388 family protein
MQKLKDIINFLETVAPLSLQEGYDNSGLLYGDPESNIEKTIVSLDLTDAVLKEAINIKAQLIIVHHPPVFKPIKRLSHYDQVSRMVIKAIQEHIAIYAIHTNLDNVIWGVNGEIANRLGLKDLMVLSPLSNTHQKLIVYVPALHTEKVRNAVFAAGGGAIGNYSDCSFSSKGIGTFKANEGSNPWTGKIGERNEEAEEKLEFLIPVHLQASILQEVQNSHPYETVAYDIVALNNQFHEIGGGAIGRLNAPMPTELFLKEVKSIFGSAVIRHNGIEKREISKVAICGGAGKSLINNALSKGADAFLTADLSYHDFFVPPFKMLLADFGHFESEQFTSELIISLVKEKFPNFAVLKTAIQTNPVHYFL